MLVEIRLYKWEIFQKINKRTCTFIPYSRVQLDSWLGCGKQPLLSPTFTIAFLYVFKLYNALNPKTNYLLKKQIK